MVVGLPEDRSQRRQNPADLRKRFQRQLAWKQYPRELVQDAPYLRRELVRSELHGQIVPTYSEQMPLTASCTALDGACE